MKSLQNAINEAMNRGTDSTLCLIKVGDTEGNYQEDTVVAMIPNKYLESVSVNAHGVQTFQLNSETEAEFKKIYKGGIEKAFVPGKNANDWDPGYYNYTIEELDKKAAKDIMLKWKGIARDAEFFADRVNSLSKYGK